ncbi:hypothetical protein NDU88_002380 [Pleurodeles waltl]|uniref:Uncharacterized protein n=1 Tax=Pleurodeles waltl TaxID=8319 RepID=A0AAV7NDL5_PLEWA|nr:hypothetical protein NDU88_002380 [Pleurodeles waltl]
MLWPFRTFDQSQMGQKDQAGDPPPREHYLTQAGPPTTASNSASPILICSRLCKEQHRARSSTWRPPCY